MPLTFDVDDCDLIADIIEDEVAALWRLKRRLFGGYGATPVPAPRGETSERLGMVGGPQLSMNSA